jgi:ABC-type transport system substrate-binding protein
MTAARSPRSWRRSVLALAVVGLIAGACTTADGQDPEPLEGAVQAPAERPVTVGPQPGGTLRIGLPSDPVSIDPRAVVDASGELIVDALFDPLVRIDDEGEPEPAAASDWSVEDGGRSFIFALREATFHDGSPVTADDFVRSFTSIADGTGARPSFLAYLLAPIEGFERTQTQGTALAGVEALDDETLRITLREPDPGYLTVLSDPSLVPVPAAALDDPDGFAEQPIGNGSFAMAGPRSPGAFVRLTAFADHHAPPLLDEVVLTFYLDDVAGDRQWQDLLDGQLQVASIGPEHQEEAEQRFGRSPDGYRGPGVIDGITATTYLYGFDVTQPPFDDVRVRRALSLAIDREALADEVMQGTRVAADALLPPPIPGSQAGTCRDCRHDPRGARTLWDEVRAELIAEAEAEAAAEAADEQDDGDASEDGSDDGASDSGADGDGADGDDAAGGEGSDGDDAVGAGESGDDADDDEPAAASSGPAAVDDGPAPDAMLDSIVLTHTRGVTHAAIAESMAADIREALDINVSFVARDLQRLIGAIRDGDVGLFRFGWEANDPDPAGYLRPLFHSENVGGDNLTNYAEPEVDELLDEARTMDLSAQRLRAFRRAERRILDDLPAMPLLWYRHQLVMSDEVRDLVYDPLGRLRLDDAWIDAGA